MKPIKMLGLAVTAALMAMALVGAGSAMATDYTALCDEDPGAGAHEVCPSGHLVTHVHEATLKGQKATLLTAVNAYAVHYIHEVNPEGSKAKLLSSIVNVQCDVLFAGESAYHIFDSLVILGNFTYTNCETASGSACEVSEVGKEATVELLKVGHELADVIYEYEVNFHCGALINCTYNGKGLEGHALGPLLAAEENGETRLEEQVTNRVSGFCPKTAKLDLLTTPVEPAYIAEETGTESTTLCSIDTGEGEESECPVTALKLECDYLFLGDATAELGTRLEVLGNLSYTNCKSIVSTECEVTEVGEDATISVLKLGHELADVTYKFEVNVHCGALINCTYNGEALLGHALGPLLASETNGETRLEEQVTTRVSGFCPKTAKLDLLTTPLEATYIAE